MDKVDLGELAERVEKLDGPAREVDAEIALACGIVSERDGDCFYGHRDHSVMVLERGYYDHEGNAPELPHYTASLDAAMSLVPEGCGWLRKDFSTMTVVEHSDSLKMWGVHQDATGATPALALVAAALRARLSTQQDGG